MKPCHTVYPACLFCRASLLSTAASPGNSQKSQVRHVGTSRCAGKHQRHSPALHQHFIFSSTSSSFSASSSSFFCISLSKLTTCNSALVVQEGVRSCTSLRPSLLGTVLAQHRLPRHPAGMLPRALRCASFPQKDTRQDGNSNTACS